MPIEWTFNARENVRSIQAYLKGQNAPKNTVSEVTRAILDAPDQLQSHPKLGRKLPEINQENFRELLHNKYRIIYLLAGEAPQKIYILNVIHGRQNIQPFLSQIRQQFLN